MRRSPTRPVRLAVVATALLAAVTLAGPPASAAAPVRYRDAVFATTTKATYTYKTPPDLVTGKLKPLGLDVYRPVGDTLATRPAIIWIHGGGFRMGDRSNMGAIAAEWAQKGYVTVSISYRLDSRGPCQALGNGGAARCAKAIDAAQADALTSVAWLRARAKVFGVDPTRIAVGGSSAGAITAVNVAQRANPGGGPVPAHVKVRAAIAMSGCQFDRASIDRNDAPISFLASGKDPLVNFDCVKATADRTQAVGTVVQRIYYPAESGHAQLLYRQHQAQVDPRYEAFLIDHLDL
ncbi:MAG: alpha/beta hydrolase [Actinobacteria bacterium]|nr:alpha/beta hydrolase [Actinomycetota bacterium]